MYIYSIPILITGALYMEQKIRFLKNSPHFSPAITIEVQL